MEVGLVILMILGIGRSANPSTGIGRSLRLSTKVALSGEVMVCPEKIFVVLSKVVLSE
jgi:hypothetical protein